MLPTINKVPVDQTFALLAAMDEIMEESREARERRTDPRVPIVRKIRIHRENSASIDGFCRDFAAGGIGMVVRDRVTPGPAILELEMLRGDRVRFRTEICWCDRLGEDWYSCGGSLLEVFADGQPSDCDFRRDEPVDVAAEQTHLHEAWELLRSLG